MLELVHFEVRVFDDDFLVFVRFVHLLFFVVLPDLPLDVNDLVHQLSILLFEFAQFFFRFGFEGADGPIRLKGLLLLRANLPQQFLLLLEGFVLAFENKNLIFLPSDVFVFFVAVEGLHFGEFVFEFFDVVLLGGEFFHFFGFVGFGFKIFDGFGDVVGYDFAHLALQLADFLVQLPVLLDEPVLVFIFLRRIPTNVIRHLNKIIITSNNFTS